MTGLTHAERRRREKREAAARARLERQRAQGVTSHGVAVPPPDLGSYRRGCEALASHLLAESPASAPEVTRSRFVVIAGVLAPCGVDVVTAAEIRSAAWKEATA